MSAMTADFYLGERKTTGDDFTERARRIATIFQQKGLKEDDVIAVLMRNDTAFLEIAEACRCLGLYYVPINWHGAKPEVEHILQDSGAKLLIGHSDLVAQFSPETDDIQIMAIPTPDELVSSFGIKNSVADGQQDLSSLITKTKPITTEPLRLRGGVAYTSGSTGRPKGIRRITDPDGPDRYQTFASLAQVLMKLTPGDRFYTAAPLYHSAPSALSLICMAAGYADLHIAPKFDPEQFLADIEKFGITHCYIVPTMMVRLLKLPEDVKKKYDTSSWKFAISTGSAWPQDVKQAMIDWFGPIFYETYGASEIGFMTLINSEEAMQKPGSVGKVLPGGSIKILDDDQNELPPGDVGSIYVHLPMFGDFSYTNAEGDLKGQRYGVHATVGDMGYLDEDDYLYISDRKKDMIISGGANIFPAEIEAALIEMPEVFDCAVFGAPHEEFGETIVAAVQCVPGKTVTLENVEAFLTDRIARMKIPRKVDVHDSLPREDTGKIFKQRLRAPYWEESGRKI